MSLQNGRRVYFLHGAQRMFRKVHVQFYLQGLQLMAYTHFNAESYFRKKQNKTKQNTEKEKEKPQEREEGK